MTEPRVILLPFMCTHYEELLFKEPVKVYSMVQQPPQDITFRCFVGAFNQHTILHLSSMRTFICNF